MRGDWTDVAVIDYILEVVYKWGDWVRSE